MWRILHRKYPACLTVKSWAVDGLLLCEHSKNYRTLVGSFTPSQRTSPCSPESGWRQWMNKWRRNGGTSSLGRSWTTTLNLGIKIMIKGTEMIRTVCDVILTFLMKKECLLGVKMIVNLRIHQAVLVNTAASLFSSLEVSVGGKIPF